MRTQCKLSQAHLCPQAADELIGYLYLLIEELHQTYCEADLMSRLGDIIPDEGSPQFNDEDPF